MTFETLENIRFFISQETRKLRIAALNSHENGYHEMARRMENEAQFGENILRDLQQEKPNAS